MFVDPTGAVLLLRRTEAGDAEGAWAFPGGKLEEGETTAEAAFFGSLAAGFFTPSALTARMREGHALTSSTVRPITSAWP